MSNKSDPFKTIKRLLWVESYTKEIDNINLFDFTEVEADNLNRMSINHVVKDIPYETFITKLKSSNRDWADGL
jgi:hypothetical protein